MSGDGARRRLDSVDLLRGVIIVVMALDHVRDFFHYQDVYPTDIATTYPSLFATRWITHFCAPVFMLLAGVGAYLGQSNGKSKGQLSKFLLTRGLWLVVLEVTVIRCLGWFWNVDYSLVLLLVIWALGMSMIALAALIWIPRAALLAICVVAIAGHNLLDVYEPHGSFGWLFTLLHVQAPLFPKAGMVVFPGYSLVPWIFVMALGYAVGPVFRWEAPKRKRALLVAGISMIAAFVVLRAINGYGDPVPRGSYDDIGKTIMSFLNCEKYPPSLCYLLMTLGPACLMLVAFEHWRGRTADFFLVFGRVPMFAYLLHLPLIHGSALVLHAIRGGAIGFFFENPHGVGPPAPPGYGVPLWATYIAWTFVIAVLYIPCRWYAEYKRTHEHWWLSYL